MRRPDALRHHGEPSRRAVAMMRTAASADRAIRIDGLRRTVTDLRRSIDFYRRALGFEPPAVLEPSPTARLD